VLLNGGTWSSLYARKCLIVTESKQAWGHLPDIFSIRVPAICVLRRVQKMPLGRHGELSSWLGLGGVFHMERLM
jgi:hypothetical protein